MTNKDKIELQKSAETITREISEKFAKLFADKVQEMVQEFSAHLDEHMDELEGMLEEGFSMIHEHLKTAERVEKLEKKVDDMEATGKGKRFVV